MATTREMRETSLRLLRADSLALTGLFRACCRSLKPSDGQANFSLSVGSTYLSQLIEHGGGAPYPQSG